MSMRRTLHRNARTARRRAATFIEFTLILPIFLFMMLFSIDMGSLMLMSGAMNDTTFSTARAASQVGGAGYNTSTGVLVCTDGSLCNDSTAAGAYKDGIEQIPFDKSLFDFSSMRIVSGAACTPSGDGAYVRVQADYTVRLITPGLSAMLSAINGGKEDHSELRDGYNLRSTGVSRCEIFRNQ
jgi:hypothetical protein